MRKLFCYDRVAYRNEFIIFDHTLTQQDLALRNQLRLKEDATDEGVCHSNYEIIRKRVKTLTGGSNEISQAPSRIYEVNIHKIQHQ